MGQKKAPQSNNLKSTALWITEGWLVLLLTIVLLLAIAIGAAGARDNLLQGISGPSGAPVESFSSDYGDADKR